MAKQTSNSPKSTSSFAPNAIKHYGGKIGVFSSQSKGKEIYGGHTISREINKGNFKHGKK